MKKLPSGRTVAQVNADCDAILADFLHQERNMRWANKFGQLHKVVFYLRDYIRERLARA